MISASWIENWDRIVPFLAFPEHLRRIVYTTNTIEALSRQIRKHVKTRGSFPTQDAARKLLYLTIQNAEQNWRGAYNWSAALAALMVRVRLWCTPVSWAREGCGGCAQSVM